MIVVPPRHFVFLTIAFLALGPGPLFGLPKRLILGVDGISYCDLKSLQEGLTTSTIMGTVSSTRRFTAITSR